MLRYSFVLIIILFNQNYSFAQIYKCTDKSTGKTIYSQIECHGSSIGNQVNIRENTLDASGSRVQTEILNQRLQREEAERQATIQRRHEAALRSRTEKTDTASNSERDRFCREASKPIPGSRGITASQRSALAACAGLSIPDQTENHRENHPSTSNNPHGSPPVITNCDVNGCWDTHGNRYNKGAGNNYFPSSGGSCQLFGGQMHCP